LSRGKPTVLALGTFDGLHLAHQQIIAEALEAWLDRAEKAKVKSHDKK